MFYKSLDHRKSCVSAYPLGGGKRFIRGDEIVFHSRLTSQADIELSQQTGSPKPQSTSRTGRSRQLKPQLQVIWH